MKSFVKELSKICDKELSALVCGYSYSVYGGHTVAIEGTTKLLSYRQDSITVAVSEGALQITGSNMTVKVFSNSYLVVVGNIIAVGVVH